MWRATNPYLTCKAVDAQIWREGEPQFRGLVRFLHADSGGPDTWIADLHVSQSGEKNWGGVGWMTTQEKAYCPWSGVHVHEAHVTNVGLGGLWDINSASEGGHFPQGSASSIHYVWEVWPFQDSYPDHNDWTRSLEW